LALQFFQRQSWRRSVVIIGRVIFRRIYKISSVPNTPYEPAPSQVANRIMDFLLAGLDPSGSHSLLNLSDSPSKLRGQKLCHRRQNNPRSWGGDFGRVRSKFGKQLLLFRRREGRVQLLDQAAHGWGG
jgi:hypothetical protein